MELLVLRDLIIDDFGNYYIVFKEEGNKLHITNAQVHHSFRRILSDDFVKEVKLQYGKSVTVGQYFQDALKNQITNLESGRTPGGIYTMSEVLNYYEIENHPFYERSATQ